MIFIQFMMLNLMMQIVNLFEFRPVQVAYTENHVTHLPMYEQVLKSYRELGRFEEIIQAGRPRHGKVGLWFSFPYFSF